MIRPCKPKLIEKKIRDLKQQFEEIWEPKAAAPLCMFFSDPKLFRLVLKSRIFPFNPFWLAGANQKITFWGPWTYFKLIVIFDFDLNIFIFVSFIP